VPSYLRDLFCLMPSWPRSRVLELAPVHWRQTVARPEVQQQLDVNIYRRATLGSSPAAALDAVR
jgi:transposase